jgi:hypothetical protein
MGSKRTRRKLSKAGFTLPDFRLAELSSFPVERLFKGGNVYDTLDQFFLALGIIFNDIKFVSWVHYQLEKGRNPDPSEISAYAGQLSAMKIQCVRYFVSMNHELFNLIKKPAVSRAIESHEFKQILSRLSADIQDKWEIIVEVAETRPSHPASRTDLGDFRRTMKDLKSGFIKHFVEDQKTPQNEKAFLSNGRTMEETRFYFADAAILAFLNSAANNDYSLFLDKLNNVFSDVNDVLKFLVVEYFKARMTVP